EESSRTTGGAHVHYTKHKAPLYEYDDLTSTHLQTLCVCEDLSFMFKDLMGRTTDTVTTISSSSPSFRAPSSARFTGPEVSN
ncbi:hypothetical protein GBF38_015860, partial [Nibea albiflora]